MSGQAPTSVPLKRINRGKSHTGRAGRAKANQSVGFKSVWDVEELHKSIITQKPPSLSLALPDEPIKEKCDRFSSARNGVCCKSLKGKDERHLVNPDVMRDA